MDGTILLPCPFCGTAPTITEIGNDLTRKRSVTIKCPSCRIQRTDAALRNSMEWLRQVAIEAWNQRYKQPEGGREDV